MSTQKHFHKFSTIIKIFNKSTISAQYGAFLQRRLSKKKKKEKKLNVTLSYPWVHVYF